MPFLAVTMGGWWIFVGALAGILSVPGGIHGWYFGIFTEAVVMWVRGYQGPVVNSLYNKKPPQKLHIGSGTSICPGCTKKSLGRVKVVARIDVYLFYLDPFPLIPATENITYC